MTEWNLRLVRQGWNDAVAKAPFDSAMALHRDGISYEYGRMLIAEMRAAAGDGEQPIEAWSEPANVVPRQVVVAMRRFRQALPELSMAQLLEQETLHRAALPRPPIAETKRRKAARLRW